MIHSLDQRIQSSIRRFWRFVTSSKAAKGRRLAVVAAVLTGAITPSLVATPSYADWPTWTAVDANGGVYWRSDGNWNNRVATPGNGFYNGNQLYLMCYVWGTTTPYSANRLWYLAQNFTTNGSSGYVNDHFLNTPGTAAHPQPVTGPC